MFGIDLAVFMGFLRHLLTAAGGVVVAMGYADEQAITALVGAIMTIAGFAASWIDKTPKD